MPILMAVEARHLLKLGDWRIHDRELPVYASHTLWQTLIRPYPSSSPSDHLQLHHLQDEVARRTECLHVPARHTYFYPCGMPPWLNPEFVIKVERHFSGEVPTRLILLLPDEYATTLTDVNPRLLPLGLLVSLICYLHRLRLVARTADVRPLETMRQLAIELTHSHPLRQHIAFRSAPFCPSIPDHLSRAEFRNLILLSLARVLPIVSAIDQSPRSSALEDCFSLFHSPSGELLDVVESLVALAAKTPQHSIPASPYRQLLWAHYHACHLVKHGVSIPPPCLLDQINRQLVPLSDHLPECFVSQLIELQQRLARLEGSRPAGPDAVLPQASGEIADWH